MRTERRLGIASAKALAAQAEVLASISGASSDPRLPSARKVLAMIKASVEASEAAAKANRKRNEQTYGVSLYSRSHRPSDSIDPLTAEIQKFCGRTPCDIFELPRYCYLLMSYQQKNSVAIGECWSALFQGKQGVMKRDGFHPDED